MDLELVRKRRLGRMVRNGWLAKIKLQEWRVEKRAQLALLLEKFRRKGQIKECSVDEETGTCTTCEIFLAVGLRSIRSRRWGFLLEGHLYSHHSTLELRKCWKKGCSLCGLFWEILVAARCPDRYRTVVSLSASETDNPINRIYIDIDNMLSSESSVSFCRVESWETPSRDTSSENRMTLRSRPSQLSPTKEVALHWLRDCCDNHAACDISEPHNSWVPSRLIDLQDLLDTGEIRLRQRNEVLAGTQYAYATLSHCWGDRAPDSSDCLHKGTESQLYRGRDIKTFCILFQEAMSFTKSLGLRYLWIDCLCIVQGRGNEWYSEAAQMLNVYGNSTVNLAASASTNGQCPLMPYRSTNSPMVLEMLSSQGTRISFRYESGWMESVSLECQPLHSRGWVLQELYLSQRVIFFTETQICWCCREFQANERSPDGRSPDLLWYESLDNHHVPFQKPGTRQTQYQMEERWQDLVIAYSQTALSYETDRLVAFSGIAKRFSAECAALSIQAKYAAGIWYHDLNDHFCWYAKSPASRANEYIAPSWSWASMGPFQCGFRFSLLETPLTVVMEVLNVSLTPLPPTNNFGQISDGYLLVKCPTYRPRERLMAREIMDALNVEIAHGIELGIYFDEKRHCGTKIDPLFCFLLCHIIPGKVWGAAEGLLLVPASAVEPPDQPTESLYERRGYWRLKLPRGTDVLDFKSPFGLKFCELFQYNPDNPEESHKETFKII